LARVEQEIAELTREIGRLQAEQPPVEGPDPQFREVLLGRLQSLEAERGWIGEEIAVREERLRRISAEVAQIRALIEMQTPDWGRSALESLTPERSGDRSVPAWKQGVLEVSGLPVNRCTTEISQSRSLLPAVGSAAKTLPKRGSRRSAATMTLCA
jgi:hypothetical protein